MNFHGILQLCMFIYSWWEIMSVEMHSLSEMKSSDKLLHFNFRSEIAYLLWNFKMKSFFEAIEETNTCFLWGFIMKSSSTATQKTTIYMTWPCIPNRIIGRVHCRNSDYAFLIWQTLISSQLWTRTDHREMEEIPTVRLIHWKCRNILPWWFRARKKNCRNTSEKGWWTGWPNTDFWHWKFHWRYNATKWNCWRIENHETHFRE